MFKRKVVGVSSRTRCRVSGEALAVVLLGFLMTGCNGSLDIGNPDIDVETGDTTVDVTTNVDQTQDVTVNVGDSENPTAVVSASPSTDVSRGQAITLDASASTPGTGGGSLSFTWSEVTGFGVVIRDAATAVATAEIPPDMDDGETIVIRVQVTAGQRADTTEVRLTVVGGPAEDDADDADSADDDVDPEAVDDTEEEVEDDDDGLCSDVMCAAGQTCDPDTGDCEAAAAVIFVDASASAGGDGTSWATAFDDIQLALSDAVNMGGSLEIWVARGTYTPAGPGGDRSTSFNMLNNIELLGGFAGTETTRSQRDIAANETILSGDLDGDDLPVFGNRSDNSFHVLTANGVADTAVLDGFTIQAGNASGASSQDRNGGGLLAINNGSPIILNCLFRENAAGGSPNGTAGGAIWGLSAMSRIENCVFTDNQSSGSGGAVSSFDVRIIDCMFSNNHAVSSGGALVFTGPGECVGCTFVANSAGSGGAALGGSYSNCRFLGNTASSAGGAINVTTAGSTIVNCEFSGNQAPMGGALQVISLVSGCTFSNNSASGSVGGVTGGTVGVENCVFWNNTDQTGATESAQLAPSFAANVSNSVIQGLSDFVGNGNISQNPQFVDPLGSDGIAGTLDDDLRLMSNSPAIDAGDNALLPDDTLDADADGDTAETTPLDLDGTARIQNGTVDMGAYENGQ